MWEIEVRHEGLNKYRHIRGSDKCVVEQKAVAQKLAWDEMWEKKLAAEQKKLNREDVIRSKEENKELATIKTIEAEDAINQLETILAQTLEVDDAIDWDSLLNNKQYPDKKPSQPWLDSVPNEPKQDDLKYQPNLGFFDRLFSILRKKKEQEAKRAFSADKELWQKNKHRIEANNVVLEKKYAEDH